MNKSNITKVKTHCRLKIWLRGFVEMLPKKMLAEKKAKRRHTEQEKEIFMFEWRRLAGEKEEEGAVKVKKTDIERRGEVKKKTLEIQRRARERKRQKRKRKS